VPFWVAVLLGFGAVARVTRFLNWDTLAKGLREWVMVRFGGTSKPYKLITCPWCASIWLAAPVAALVVQTTPYGAGWRIATAVGLWLSYSYVYSLIATNLDGDE
jgi:hypothetical protein